MCWGGLEKIFESAPGNETLKISDSEVISCVTISLNAFTLGHTYFGRLKKTFI